MSKSNTTEVLAKSMPIEELRDNLVVEGCKIKAEITRLQAELERINGHIYPLLNPGECVQCELGTVTMMEGKTNTKWLVPDSQKKELQQAFDAEMDAKGFAKKVPGAPFLQYSIKKVI